MGHTMAKFATASTLRTVVTRRNRQARAREVSDPQTRYPTAAMDRNCYLPASWQMIVSNSYHQLSDVHLVFVPVRRCTRSWSYVAWALSDRSRAQLRRRFILQLAELVCQSGDTDSCRTDAHPVAWRTRE